MEYAIWNDKRIAAFDVAQDYSFEKAVRKASGRKELLCPDPDCENPELRYCHGDVKSAYFAHLNNDSCDYALFDKQNTEVINLIRKKLYDHFKSLKYDVQMEVKVLEHHYTHLLFTMPDKSLIALEIGDQNISANRVDYLYEEYQKQGIEVKWVVVGKTDFSVKENQVFFLKRYLLNESTNKDLIVINWDCSEVAQYKIDPNPYVFNYETIESKNYPKAYEEFSTIDKLVLENNELTLEGFNSRYNQWLNKKQRAFAKKVEQLEEELRQRREKQKRREEYLQFQRKTIYEKPLPSIDPTSVNAIEPKKNIPEESFEERKQAILPFMDQQEEQVLDANGTRWVRCSMCGKISTIKDFFQFGGLKRVNLGLCYECRDKMK